MKFSRIACIAAVLLAQSATALFSTSVSAQGQEGEGARKRPPRPDRVYVKDIEGVWIKQSYLEALKSTRSPRQAAQKSTPLVVQMKRDKGVYPILTTNFRSAVMHFLIDVEPDAKPRSWRLVTAKSEGIVNSQDVIYVYFTGKRAAGGRFESLSIREPHFAKRRATIMAPLADPLENVVNRLTVAGSYKDERGAAYEFTEAGEAQLPDRKFPFEVLLDAEQSDCDLMTSHHEKAPNGGELLGFAFKGENLLLYKVARLGNARWKCEAQPFATLTRGNAT